MQRGSVAESGANDSQANNIQKEDLPNRVCACLLRSSPVLPTLLPWSRSSGLGPGSYLRTQGMCDSSRPGVYKRLMVHLSFLSPLPGGAWLWGWGWIMKVLTGLKRLAEPKDRSIIQKVSTSVAALVLAVQSTAASQIIFLRPQNLTIHHRRSKG